MAKSSTAFGTSAAFAVCVSHVAGVLMKEVFVKGCNVLILQDLRKAILILANWQIKETMKTVAKRQGLISNQHGVAYEDGGRLQSTKPQGRTEQNFLRDLFVSKMRQVTLGSARGKNMQRQ